MRDSGLAHLLSISGLHMGLVAGLLFFALRAGLALLPAVALYWPIKKWAAVGAAGGAFVYINLCGDAIPAERAFLMVLVVLLAVLLERRAIRSEEHTSELQSLMRISYAVFCLKKKKHRPMQ